jgi:hypothetical protein
MKFTDRSNEHEPAIPAWGQLFLSARVKPKTSRHHGKDREQPRHSNDPRPSTWVTWVDGSRHDSCGVSSTRLELKGCRMALCEKQRFGTSRRGVRRLLIELKYVVSK